MHYVKFDIEKWVQSTRHLLPEEEGVYLRLVSHYYDIEGPLPLDNRMMIKRLQLLSYQQTVDDILAEYFEKTDKGYFHKKCEVILKNYRQTRKKNSANGKKGGRPSNRATLSGTQPEPSGLGLGTQNKATGKAIINYKLGTINEDKDKPLARKRARANGRFKEPTIKEVDTYLAERKIEAFNSETFCDFYIARGWELSNGKKMKDWKAAVRTWENRRNNENPPSSDYGKGGI